METPDFKVAIKNKSYKKYFCGIYALDEIKVFNKCQEICKKLCDCEQNIGYIIWNTEESKFSGEHWLLLTRLNQTDFFLFDSFGVTNPEGGFSFYKYKTLLINNFDFIFKENETFRDDLLNQKEHIDYVCSTFNDVEYREHYRDLNAETRFGQKLITLSDFFSNYIYYLNKKNFSNFKKRNSRNFVYPINTVNVYYNKDRFQKLDYLTCGPWCLFIADILFRNVLDDRSDWINNIQNTNRILGTLFEKINFEYNINKYAFFENENILEAYIEQNFNRKLYLNYTKKFTLGIDI